MPTHGLPPPPRRRPLPPASTMTSSARSELRRRFACPPAATFAAATSTSLSRGYLRCRGDLARLRSLLPRRPCIPALGLHRPLRRPRRPSSFAARARRLGFQRPRPPPRPCPPAARCHNDNTTRGATPTLRSRRGRDRWWGLAALPLSTSPHRQRCNFSSQHLLPHGISEVFMQQICSLLLRKGEF